MANNKVQLANGTTLMDITDTTAEETDVASGKVFYKADGTQAIGTMSGNGWQIIQSSIALSGTLAAHAGTMVSSCAIDVPLGYSVVAHISEFVNGVAGIVAGPNQETDYNKGNPDIYLFNTSASSRNLSSGTLRILTIIKPM